MIKKIKLLINIFFLILLLIISSKAELSNKIIISVGNEIISNYDLDRELKYLSIITVGKFKTLNKEQSREIAIDSLVKDRIKTNVLKNYKNITMSDELVTNQIKVSIRNIGFRSIEDFKKYLEYERYDFEEFKKKILLELKWNQLVYQFYKNQIVIDKEKIDKQLKKFISEQKTIYEYLVYEIFIDNLTLKNSENETTQVVEPEYNVVVTEIDGITIEAESAAYNDEKIVLNKEKIIEEKPKIKKDNKITIEALLQNIKEEGFKNTAIKYSSSPTSKLGGKLGWVNEKKFSKLLISNIKKTKLGTTTNPIPISGGILILKVEDKRAEEKKMDLDNKMKQLIEMEKNSQLDNFSTNYFNQIKNSIKIKYFND